jgi:hypothetical protein
MSEYQRLLVILFGIYDMDRCAKFSLLLRRVGTAKFLQSLRKDSSTSGPSAEQALTASKVTIHSIY